MYETDEEEFSGRQETVLHDQMAYETDEEEFLGTGDTDASPVILTHYATLEHTRGPVEIENIAKRDLSVQRRGRKSNTHTHGYNLSYFNLWWSRMAVEGRKDDKERKKMKEEELRGQRRMKMKSKNNKKASTMNELLEEENLDGPD